MIWKKNILNYHPSYTEYPNKDFILDFEKSLNFLDLIITSGGHKIAKESFQSFATSNGWSLNVSIGLGKRRIFAQKNTTSLFFNSGPPGMSTEQLAKLNAMKKEGLLEFSIFVFLFKVDSEKITKGGMAYYEKFIIDFNQIYKYSFDFPLIVYGLGNDEY